MKKSAFALSLAFALFFVSCKQEKEDVGPDLTTPLVGQYFGDYMIAGPGTGPQGITSSPTGLTLIRIQRKNNQEIYIDLIINDGSIQFNKRYDANVAIYDPLAEFYERYPPQGYVEPRPVKYKIDYEGNISVFDAQKDGKLAGGFISSYDKEKQQTVIISFNP